MNYLAWEVQAVCCVVTLSLLARNVITMYIIRTPISTRKKFALDFSVLVLPILCVFTVLHQYWRSVYGTLATFSICVLLIHNVAIVEKWRKPRSAFESLLDRSIQPLNGFLSAHRAFILISTNIAILAVDFPSIFPKRFEKSEVYGSSLMDVGVGCFVLASHGMVSPEARGLLDGSRSFAGKLSSLKKALASSAALLALGFVRLASVVALNYNVKVSEYGVHWNFFFTLAAIKILSTAILVLAHPKYSLPLALVILTSYEVALSKFSLRQYILKNDDAPQRLDIFEANKGGLFSTIGYLSLYFTGVALGRHIFLVKRATVKDWAILLGQSTVSCLILLVSLDVSTRVCDEISRRLANLSFVIWIILYNLVLLSSQLGVELLFSLVSPGQTTKDSKKEDEGQEDSRGRSDECDFCLLRSTTYNGLLFFLLGNVLTGLVNLTVDTTSVGAVPAFLIIVAYMLVTTAVNATLFRYRIRTKIW